MADNTGRPLACATPPAGNHHNVFCISPLFEELCGLLEQAQIALEGLFLPADSGFDTKLPGLCRPRQRRQQCP